MLSESQFGEGAHGAFAEVFGGIILAIVMTTVTASNLVPSSYKLLFGLLPTLLTLTLLVSMTRWTIIYSAGWMFGVGVMIYANLLPPFEIALYLGVPIAVWIISGWMHYNNNGSSDWS